MLLKTTDIEELNVMETAPTVCREVNTRDIVATVSAINTPPSVSVLTTNYL